MASVRITDRFRREHVAFVQRLDLLPAIGHVVGDGRLVDLEEATLGAGA